MGKVVEKVKVTNFKDPSKSLEIEAVIDTGATMSVLPMDTIQRLGLEKIEDVNVRYADNRVEKKRGLWKVIPNPRSPETPMIEIFLWLKA